MSENSPLAVVTGGTGALGMAVVEALVARGWRVVVPAHKEEGLERFPLRDDPRVRVVVAGDLTEEAQAVRLYRDLLGDCELRASIHVAGGFAMAPLVDTAADDLDRMWRMNAVSAFLCCREAARRMASQSPDAAGVRGRIVNVSAKAGLAPETGAGMAAYTVSKAAVAAMTQTLAAELKPRGVWVNAVVPSIFDTPANREAMPDADHDAWPKPADLAQTVCFLATDENRATHGALVPVYGRS